MDGLVLLLVRLRFVVLYFRVSCVSYGFAWMPALCGVGGFD